MWTNVFKIGGLHQISWFQFLPHESDLNPLPEKSVKIDQKDAAMLLVLSSHLQLQKEGFLSSWTNSFVGPWDPSQGVHNPDEKIKLWLFLPGRHSSVVETAQPAVSRLRVVASGLWKAPGDSEEVAGALSQALRNCIERALIGLSYMRFGDVFSQCHQCQVEETSRRGQPTVEFMFAATEEAIFVHVVVSSKHIRTLSSGDLEKVLKHSTEATRKLPVIVSPHGILGSLTGCSPSDLVKQGYFRSSNGIIGLPHHISQSFGCQLRGQNCYVEVSLGFPRSAIEKISQPNSNGIKNLPKLRVSETTMPRSDQKGSPNHLLDYEKTFLYPSEAVLVPVLQTSFARSSLRRFWLQNWMGPSLPGSSFFMHCAYNVDSTEDPWSEANGNGTQHGYDSSSNSNSRSISSSSASSSDSDFKITGPSELEADADSLTCRQSAVSSGDQLENNGSKLGPKRPRSGVTESLIHVGKATNVPVQDAYMSDFGSMEVNDSAITAVANEQIGSDWDWDDDDRGMEMDIQALLSEFGDFGDFFENDVLPFGEPPGTAESQALIFSAPDCGDVNSSPVGMMDIPDQMLLPVGFSSFDSFIPPSSAAVEECLSKTQDNMNPTMSLAPVSHAPMSSMGEFDHIIKAEAMMTFAPEFGAVETPTSELSTTLFKSPYFPNSRKSESVNSSSNNYSYSAAPPSSPCIERSEGKNGMSINTKVFPGKHDANMTTQSKSCYTYVESRNVADDKRSHISDDNIIAKSEGFVQPPFCNIGSNASVKLGLRKLAEGSLEAEHFLLSSNTLLATDIACIMFQASMCKLRHVLLSSSNLMHVGLGKSTGATILNHLSSDPSNTTDNISGKFEVKKKENIPVRIAGDIDGGMFDGHHNAPVGVWRTVVGVSKGVKPSNSPNMDVSSSFSHNSFNEEGILSYGQRQPLQELLDGIALLVQQATSFVDLALDADCCDGPYGWLALHEQWRRRFCCGPSMIHAGCGGTLASSHSLDIAGVELVDPLSADVHASTVISLLQSDIKTALKSAFSNLEGPLYVTDWCKGRNQLIDAGSMIDGVSAESSISDCRDSSEPMSPSQSSVGGSSSLKMSSMMDGAKVDETSQRRSAQDADTEQPCSRLRPTLIALPFPSILVGYQDDWLKTSASCLQHWEKAPLEPYALQKPITYQIVCPDIDPLTSAAADFFQQLGTVYETCKLGTHSPQGLGNPMEIDSGKLSSSGFVLLDSPQSMKIESSNASFVGSISDYFLSLSNGWDLTSYLKSLSKALRALKLGPCLSTNSNEGSNSSCMVIYVVCPFPDPTAILQTVIESSVAIGSVIQQSDRERRSALHSQFVKALSGLATVDEASTSNILVLSGFSIPKLVLQVVTVDAIFRVTNPSVSEVVILKETAFTVYNKARRISRGSSHDGPQSAFSNRSHSVLTQMSSPISGMWKDCIGPRITGHSLPREGDIDASLRSGTWDNSWQPARTGGLSCDPSRSGDYILRDENRYMFEPLFILADPGSLEHGISFSRSLTSESSKDLAEDSSGNYIQNTSILGTVDSASSLDVLESDQKAPPSLHCCYGWTEDWRWLVCIWTDSRGELLDSNIFPFGGISSRQDTKGLQCLFVQVLQQGCQLLQSCSSSDIGVVKPRDFVIARIGGFYELEYLEWQKAIYSVGGSEMKRWPLQLRRSMSAGLSATSNGTTLQQTEIALMQERTLPSSPSPLYSPHAKASGFVKGSLGQAAARKQLMGGHPLVDNSRGLLHWAQSISFVAISMDHTLQLVLPVDSSSPGGTPSGSGMSVLGYIEGFTPVKSLGSTSSAYLLIPSPSMRFLPPTIFQLPTCLTAESPPLAHLLHSKGSALPLSTGFVVSKAVPSMKKDNRSNLKEEWPSILSVNLIDYYGGTNIVRGINKQGSRSLSWEAKDFEIETHLILESLAAELHALSWMTVSPAYLERRTALPFHCDMVLRVRRLLHFADKELSKQSEKS